jgi:hypothetical protein
MVSCKFQQQNWWWFLLSTCNRTFGDVFTVCFTVCVKSQQISIQWEVTAQYHTLQVIWIMTFMLSQWSEGLPSSSLQYHQMVATVRSILLGHQVAPISKTCRQAGRSMKVTDWFNSIQRISWEITWDVLLFCGSNYV